MSSSRTSSLTDNESTADNDTSCVEGVEETSFKNYYAGKNNSPSVKYVISQGNSSIHESQPQYYQVKDTTLLPSVTAVGQQLFLENNYVYKTYSYLPPYANSQAKVQNQRVLPQPNNVSHYLAQRHEADFVASKNPEVVSIRYFAPLQQINSLIAKGETLNVSRNRLSGNYSPYPVHYMPNGNEFNEKRIFSVDPNGLAHPINYAPPLYSPTANSYYESSSQRASNFDLSQNQQLIQQQTPQLSQHNSENTKKTKDDQNKGTYARPVSSTWNMAGGMAKSSNARYYMPDKNYNPYYPQYQPNVEQGRCFGLIGQNGNKGYFLKIGIISVIVAILVLGAIAGIVLGVVLPMKLNGQSASKSTQNTNSKSSGLIPSFASLNSDSDNSTSANVTFANLDDSNSTSPALTTEYSNLLNETSTVNTTVGSLEEKHSSSSEPLNDASLEADTISNTELNATSLLNETSTLAADNFNSTLSDGLLDNNNSSLLNSNTTLSVFSTSTPQDLNENTALPTEETSVNSKPTDSTKQDDIQNTTQTFNTTDSALIINSTSESHTTVGLSTTTLNKSESTTVVNPPTVSSTQLDTSTSTEISSQTSTSLSSSATQITSSPITASPTSVVSIVTNPPIQSTTLPSSTSTQATTGISVVSKA